jgi:hypothetical protein
MGEADLDDLVAEGDDPGSVDQPLNFDAAGGGQAPGAFSAGGGPAGRAPCWRSRARSTADSREGTVLIRQPPMLRCTVVVSIQNLTVWPVLLVPSQNCCGPTVMFPAGSAGACRT